MSNQEIRIQSAHEQVNQIFYKALSGENRETKERGVTRHRRTSDAVTPLESSGNSGVTQRISSAQKLRPNEQGEMVEDHGGNFTADRYEANRDFCDEQEERWSLRDDGRSEGYGDSESYAERNA